MANKLAITFAIAVLLAIPAALAVTTTTQVFFNVESVTAFTLTLPGEGAVVANDTGAPTTAIEFNSSTGTDANVNARVVGGAEQLVATPIFQFDNSGTVPVNVTVVLNQTTPACINLTGATTFAGADAGAQINNPGTTVVQNNLGVGSQVDWFMKADFTGCNASDTTVRTMTSEALES